MKPRFRVKGRDHCDEAGDVFITGEVLHIDSLKQIEDRVSQWRKRFGEQGLEALEEITFNDLPTNDTATRSWWCEWALSTGDDTCRPYYYSTYNEPEDEESQLKAKVLFALHYASMSLTSQVTFIRAFFSPHSLLPSFQHTSHGYPLSTKRTAPRRSQLEHLFIQSKP